MIVGARTRTICGPARAAVTYGDDLRKPATALRGAYIRPGERCGPRNNTDLSGSTPRASRNEPPPRIWLDTAMSAIRGCGLVWARSICSGAPFGIYVWYLEHGLRRSLPDGFRPTIAYKPATASS